MYVNKKNISHLIWIFRNQQERKVLTLNHHLHPSLLFFCLLWNPVKKNSFSMSSEKKKLYYSQSNLFCMEITPIKNREALLKWKIILKNFTTCMAFFCLLHCNTHHSHYQYEYSLKKTTQIWIFSIYTSRGKKNCRPS